MIIRQAHTRGMRYELILEQVSANLFDIVSLTHGRVQGKCCNIPTLVQANKRFNTIVADSAEIDGINYLE